MTLTRELIEKATLAGINQLIDDLVMKGDEYNYPDWVTDMSAAFEIVSEMRKRGWVLYALKHESNKGKFDLFSATLLNLETGASREVIDSSPATALCKAALLSLITE